MALRRPRDEDAQAIFDRYASDPEVTRYLSWPTHRSLDDTRGFILCSHTEWGRSGIGPLLVESRADGTLLGSTGLEMEESAAAATGYAFARDAWGKGIASEALRAVIVIAAAMRLSRLHACCHVDHAPSIRVLERCGFTREGPVCGQPVFPNLVGEQRAWSFARAV